MQVADLFAGLGVYSRANYERYPAWRVAAAGQLALFNDAEAGSLTLTSSDRERCPVLHELVERCRVRRLGVGLEGSHGLETRNPRNPINFWVYRPQRLSDKAPAAAGYGTQRRRGSLPVIGRRSDAR